MGVTLLSDEKELLAKIAGGDERAFKTVYEKFNRKVYTYSLRLLHTPILAEEVMQEVFVKLWVQGNNLKQVNNLEAYLRTLTRNRCYNVMRRIVLERKADDELTVNYIETHNETEEGIMLNDTRNLLNAAIQTLPQQQREVYLLCQNEGLKYEEVALRLNISTNTVKTHMKRALAALRLYVKSNADLAALLIVLKIF